MKCFRSRRPALFLVVTLGAAAAFAELPSWIRNLEASTAVEAVFFRMMSLPGGAVAFRRPPKETSPELGNLIKAQPRNAELYSLRALEDEQQIDFTAAETDWKSFVDNSSDKVAAQLALADFYHRRLRPADEIKTLSLIANAPPLASEKLTLPPQQRSWRSFDRIFGVIQDQGLPKDVSIAQYRAWIARYPQEQSLYARFLQFLVSQKEYAAATQLVADYHKQFPKDEVFPVKAKAMVQYRQGSVREGLAVYEQDFEPVWDPELVKSYFDLLRETQNLRKFLDQARATLKANPEDLNATARVFYYYQQQGKIDVAQQAIADFRLHKEASKSPWTSQQLYICARLLEDVHSYAEAARYYFALYNSKEMSDAQERAVAGLTNLLLTAPETNIRFGTGELSMYRDIATMDQGPGYLNGILSLILNTTEPATRYSEEEQRAVPYFHRSRAAELLALLDAKFSNSAERPELHAKLLDFYAGSGESDAVIQGGREFLASFPTVPQRTTVSLLMADAYARKHDTASEFAIYDSVLKELADQAQNVPLGMAAEQQGEYQSSYGSNIANPSNTEAMSEEGEGGGEGESEVSERSTPREHPTSQAFKVNTPTATAVQSGPRSPEYARVLERYLARLVETKQIPKALNVLAVEIDHNPDDPGLYERLAVFLDQNRLGTQQEEVYRRAIARFQDRSWTDKLARFYIRYRRDSDFEKLTEDAIKSFNGTDLERYFANIYGGSPQMYLRLNLLANQRFPHNPVFVRNLLNAYMDKHTYDPLKWEILLRQHWFEDQYLRNEFFEYLSRTHKLNDELSSLRQSVPNVQSWESNPAAASFIAHADLWRSHFEESAPLLKSLAAQYPADPEIAQTASSVYRSLAYYEPINTAVAVKIEDNLLQANPRSTEILARIGDIYSDKDRFSDAAPYWERIPQVSPGQSSGYLEAATIYWDYYDFENALRLLNKGRERLADQSLYAYEAGGICENKRDYPRAVEEYVKGALASAADSQAELRLLELARRPRHRELVDQSTTNIATLPTPSLRAIDLRVKVLEAQERKKDVESFLDGIAQGTTSIEHAEYIENLAQQKSFELVRQHALEKQAALTGDPVARLRIRYALVQLYEGRKDFASAENTVEALYQENPKILGVVRSTVDFCWRTKNYTRAISVLEQAAKDANPELSGQFTYEAARKSTEAKQYQHARDLLAGLLKNSPYNGEYLAAMADTYAREGDDRGLQQYYIDKIALFRTASLPEDTRKAQIATLRRGLIVALTRLKEYSAAVDQYIELINKFPDDDALATETALYALRYQRQQQIVDFYSKTVAQSPRDYHWSMILAHIYTNLENYPAAIDTYAKSIAVRPDRADMYIARAGLEERLMRFDDAIADYEKIYQLAYKDPQWMLKVAEIRARQGKVDAVVAALKTAMIDGRPENAEPYAQVANKLESWGMILQARDFAEQAVNIAGTDLLAESEHSSTATTYLRIMTRLRQHEQAYARMQAAVDAASSVLPVIKEQVVKQGIGGLTDSQWRERVRQTRIYTARHGMATVLETMGTTANAYFTPEERLNFAHFVESKCNGMSVEDLDLLAIPWAQSAGLADQEARWRFDLIMQHARSLKNNYPNTRPLIDLQERRGRFAELASQMEQLAAVLPSGYRDTALLTSVEAYRYAGNEQEELRVLTSIGPEHLSPPNQQRYFELLLKRRPQELVQVAARWNNDAGQKAADYILANADSSLSHSMLEARGKVREPIWTKSYTGLAGLYLAEKSSTVRDAFLRALGDQTIAERLANPVDRSQQLAGKTWFYYGSSYGEYLGLTKQGNPEDFLPSQLELSPASPAGYLSLADYYAGTGDTQRAIADYKHTLELSPNRPSIYDSLALAYFKQGDKATALAQWKQAYALLLSQAKNPPETFWADFGRTCDQLRTRQLFSELKPDADAILRSYIRRNGNYRSNALLRPAYMAVADPSSATSWLIDLASTGQDPTAILADVVDASWVPLSQRAPLYQKILQLKQDAVGKLSGYEKSYAETDFGAWQVRWIKYLVRTKQFSQAADAIAALPKTISDAQSTALVPIELQLAAQLGTHDAKIANYRANPQEAPAAESLRAAARQLFEAGDKQSARKIFEFVFAREIDEHQLNAANFLGLAEIRLASGDTPGALDLLRRLVVVVGNPFENLEPAAAFLEKTNHNAEAIEFLDQLVKAYPWEASYRVRLAKAQLAAGQNAAAASQSLFLAASANTSTYAVRIQAASALGPSRTIGDLGSGELNLLAEYHNGIPAAMADKFYYYEARMNAAQGAVDAQTKSQLFSHCIIDFPRRDDARVPLFQALAAQQSYQFAVAVLEPMTQAEFLGKDNSNAESEEGQIISSDDDSSTPDTGPNFVPGAKLSRAQQAQVAAQLGDVMARLNRLGEAVTHYKTARRLETAMAVRKQLVTKISELSSTLRMQAQNAQRRPVFHQELEQDHLVHPRLLARVTPASKPAAKGGTKQ